MYGSQPISGRRRWIALWVRHEVLVALAEWRAGVAAGGECADGYLGMPEQEPQQLPTRVPARRSRRPGW